MNKVILIGNVGQDPDVVNFDWGDVAKFSLATTKNYKNRDGEKVAETAWHNIVIKGKLTGVVEKYVKKGSKLALEGEIAYRSYEDKEKNKKYVTEIVCFNMEMLDSKPQEKKKEPEVNTGLPENDSPPPDLDDLPY